MSADVHERTRRLVDAHFLQRIAEDGERELRGHVADCDACRTYYERRLLLADLDPGAPARKARMLGALGLRRPRPLAHRLWPVAVPAMAAAAALVIALWPSSPDGFLARGGDGQPELVVRRTDTASPTRAVDDVPPGVELAFGYTNPTGAARLLVFGVDEHGHVFWYHPAWTEPADNPIAIDIDTTVAPIALKTGIRHDLDGARLDVYGVFTDERATVRDVEKRLADHGPEGLRALGVVWQRSLRVAKAAP